LYLNEEMIVWRKIESEYFFELSKYRKKDKIKKAKRQSEGDQSLVNDFPLPPEGVCQCTQDEGQCLEGPPGLPGCISILRSTITAIKL